jgi:hypothetical protein
MSVFQVSRSRAGREKGGMRSTESTDQKYNVLQLLKVMRTLKLNLKAIQYAMPWKKAVM